LNLTNNSSVPYIILPRLDLKILLDTGSTKSFVTPQVAEKYFKRDIQGIPFNVTTANGTSFVTHRTEIQCADLFKINNLIIKAHLFKFYSYFDSPLRLDNLKVIGAKIDLANNVIQQLKHFIQTLDPTYTFCYRPTAVRTESEGPSKKYK
jgi:hypothetical protein